MHTFYFVAEMPVPKNSQSIDRIKNLEHTLVPTVSIDVRPDKVYNRIVTVQRYDNSFELVGGINAPKKITSHGSDGKRRNQLVKVTRVLIIII